MDEANIAEFFRGAIQLAMYMPDILSRPAKQATFLGEDGKKHKSLQEQYRLHPLYIDTISLSNYLSYILLIYHIFYLLI